MLVVSERWVGERDRLLYWAKLFLDRSSTSSSSWLGCSTVGYWGLQSPLSASWFSRWHPVLDWLWPPGHLVRLFSIVHLLPLFFRFFTQVHLLIDGSVEGQYITQITWLDISSSQHSQLLLLCRDFHLTFFRFPMWFYLENFTNITWLIRLLL